jgi:Uma2 family endonuclease
MLIFVSDMAKKILEEDRRYTYADYKAWELDEGERDESDDTVVQPDLAVICGEEKRGDEGARGAPDLIVEILYFSRTKKRPRSGGAVTSYVTPPIL